MDGPTSMRRIPSPCSIGSGRDEYAYTHKAAGWRVLGQVSRLAYDRSRSRVVLGAGDWTRAQSSRVTEWKWASLSHRFLRDGTPIGLNLSAQVYEDDQRDTRWRTGFGSTGASSASRGRTHFEVAGRPEIAGGSLADREASTQRRGRFRVSSLSAHVRSIRTLGLVRTRVRAALRPFRGTRVRDARRDGNVRRGRGAPVGLVRRGEVMEIYGDTSGLSAVREDQGSSSGSIDDAYRSTG